MAAKKDFRRLAYGVGMVAAEAAKRSANSGELAGTLKAALLAAADLAGLTRGTVRHVSATSAQSKEGSSVVYFSDDQTEIPTSNITPDHHNTDSTLSIETESKLSLFDKSNESKETITKLPDLSKTKEEKINRFEKKEEGTERTRVGTISTSGMSQEAKSDSDSVGTVRTSVGTSQEAKSDSDLVGTVKTCVGTSQEAKSGSNSVGTVKTSVGTSQEAKSGSDLVGTVKRRRVRERSVPSTPFTRALGFAGLGAGLVWGTAQETAKRILYGQPQPQNGKQQSNNPFLSERNAERLGLALCRMRGAALKIGQMLSIQDESLVPKPETAKRILYGSPKPQNDKQQSNNPFLSERNAERLGLALCRMRGAALKIGQMMSIQDDSLVPRPILDALEIVRQGADVMPKKQLNSVLNKELGANWSSKLKSFDYEPLAAASIGQVHKAVLKDGTEVAIKIQYPGVADSIESDIENVKLLLNYTNLIPKGLFLDRAIKVAKEELARECDYILEAESQKRFSDFLSDSEGFYVPKVFDELSSRKVLTTEFVAGIPIDKVATLDQETRNYVGTKLLEITLKELFVFRFMQTDPNWSNFLFDEPSKMFNLIDFGAARDYPQTFVDDYLRMVVACANSDRDSVIEMSRRLGFLTGEESEIMIDAHVQAAFIVGLPFSKPGGYDFRANNITQNVSNLGATMLRHRLTPPPDEAYSLHRKLSGAFLACVKLGAVVACREILFDIYDKYEFGLGDVLSGAA